MFLLNLSNGLIRCKPWQYFTAVLLWRVTLFKASRGDAMRQRLVETEFTQGFLPRIMSVVNTLNCILDALIVWYSLIFFHIQRITKLIWKDPRQFNIELSLVSIDWTAEITWVDSCHYCHSMYSTSQNKVIHFQNKTTSNLNKTQQNKTVVILL